MMSKLLREGPASLSVMEPLILSQQCVITAGGSRASVPVPEREPSQCETQSPSSRPCGEWQWTGKLSKPLVHPCSNHDGEPEGLPYCLWRDVMGVGSQATSHDKSISPADVKLRRSGTMGEQSPLTMSTFVFISQRHNLAIWAAASMASDAGPS